MNPLGGTLICILHIIFQVLPPRLQGDCHPSSRVTVAVMSFSSRRRPHRFHLPSVTQGGKGERSNLFGGPLYVPELMVYVYPLCLCHHDNTKHHQRKAYFFHVVLHHQRNLCVLLTVLFYLMQHGRQVNWLSELGI